MGLFDFFKTQDINAGVRDCAADENAQLVDVRETDEFQEEHIPNAVNLPLSHLNTADKVFPNKDKPLYLYCYSGARSAQAATVLKRMGYTNVRNIGGINHYQGTLE